MRLGCFVSSGGVDELMLELFQMKEHGFSFIGDRLNEKWKGFSYVGDDDFKCIIGFNWSFGRISHLECCWGQKQGWSLGIEPKASRQWT